MSRTSEGERTHAIPDRQMFGRLRQIGRGFYALFLEVRRLSRAPGPRRTGRKVNYKGWLGFDSYEVRRNVAEGYYYTGEDYGRKNWEQNDLNRTPIMYQKNQS